MNFSPFHSVFNSVWTLPEERQPVTGLLYFLFWGCLTGLAAGFVIGMFRVSTASALQMLRGFAGEHLSLATIVSVFLIAACAALATGFLIRNRAISFGGEPWIRKALVDGQSSVWRKILLPKFVGSWLVMAFGISVGSEGPCIQMGASTALGLHNIKEKKSNERRYFILGGCAAGLASAFSAPFAGIFYIYEVMNEKLDRSLLVYLLGGSFGVYVSVTQFWGLGLFLPFGQPTLPEARLFLLLLPLGFFAGLVGVAYNYLLRASVSIYTVQKVLPRILCPLLPFLATALMLLFFPGITGEGMGVFTSIKDGQAFAGFLCFFLLVKLFFTAFCYGSGIPAGLMVPVLCLGGVAGGIYADLALYAGWIPPELASGFIVMGMAAAFAGAERAPLTGLVLVLEMTGAWATAPGMLLVASIGALCARISRVRNV